MQNNQKNNFGFKKGKYKMAKLTREDFISALKEMTNHEVKE